MRALHEKFVIHRDLKLDNILMNKEGDDYVLKIADLGFAKELDFE